MPNQIQAKSQKSKMPPRGWRNRAPRVSAYQVAPPNFFRRLFRLIFNPITLLTSLLLLLGVILTFTYFWFEYSDRIDLLL
ncbi:MAG: hypothetical protein LH614_20795, partial [Pyrinomonadaceae bacterium]|nr:hypothetical protein [Pyrinomonadaceae bacterium]